MLRMGKYTRINKILLSLRTSHLENRKVLTPKNNMRQILINFIIVLLSYDN